MLRKKVVLPILEILVWFTLGGSFCFFHLVFENVLNNRGIVKEAMYVSADAVSLDDKTL